MINDDSGVDWIHNVQARLYASAGVFTVVALKRDQRGIDRISSPIIGKLYA
jgi:hypothetical protein